MFFFKKQMLEHGLLGSHPSPSDSCAFSPRGKPRWLPFDSRMFLNSQTALQTIGIHHNFEARTRFMGVFFEAVGRFSLGFNPQLKEWMTLDDGNPWVRKCGSLNLAFALIVV